MSGKERIYHFDANDLAYDHYFSILVKRLSNGVDFNDRSPKNILEFIEIIMFGNDQNNIQLNEKQRNYLKGNKKIKEIRSAVTRFFQDCSSSDIYFFIQQICDGEYELVLHKNSFIKYFVANSIYKRINKSDFLNLLRNGYLSLEELCLYKTLVEDLSVLFHNYIVENNLIDLIVKKYDSGKSDEKNELFLPVLSNEEINTLISNYLNSNKVNIGVLVRLRYHRNSKDSYSVSPENKERIIKIYDLKQKEEFNKATTIRFGINISLSDTQEQVLTNTFENGIFKIFLSKKYLDSIQTPFQAISFVTSLLLIDRNRLINGIYYSNVNASILDAITNTYKGRYGNDSYDFVESINVGVFAVIYEYLSSKNIFIEDGARAIVDDINSKAKNAQYSIELKHLEKPYYKTCENLFNEMQSILRQHNVYAKEGSMELEKIIVDDSDARFDQIRSLFTPKYLEKNKNDTLDEILYYLFSYASLPVNIVKNKVNDFAQLIDEHSVKYNEYISRYPSTKSALDILIKNDILIIEKGIIEFFNPLTIKLLNVIYKYECLPYFILSNSSKTIADSFLSKGFLKKSNCLFSKTETEYLSYIFDSQKYTNSLSLRNKYEHGYGKHFSEKQSKKDYLIGLMATLAIVSKIYDEFVQNKFGGSR